MRNALRAALFFAALLLPGLAQAQCSFPAPLPPNVVIGRLGINPGPCQAIPIASLNAQTLSARSVNTTSPLLGGGNLGADLTLSLGTVPFANLPTGTQDTALGYWASTTLSANAIPNCTGALIYSTSTHLYGCNNSAGTGTVTQVNLAGFLSGGPITTTGTINGAFVPALSASFGAL